MDEVMMATSHCDSPPQYGTVVRTVVGSLLWIAIIAAYTPQYHRIRKEGTKGISAYYILNHALFSTTTLALRLSHSVFYTTFNCVASGELQGWRGYSASLDFLAVFVQWMCAVILLVVYVRHRTPAVLPDQAPIRRLSDWQPEEAHEHKLTSHKMRRMLVAYAGATLPISLLLLIFNVHPTFQNHRLHTAVYVVFWSIWVALLCAVDAFLVVFQFIKQLKTVGRLRTRGSLSIVSVLLLSIVLILLAVTQFYRSRGNIVLPRERHVSFGRFLQLFGLTSGKATTRPYSSPSTISRRSPVQQTFYFTRRSTLDRSHPFFSVPTMAPSIFYLLFASLFFGARADFWIYKDVQHHFGLTYVYIIFLNRMPTCDEAKDVEVYGSSDDVSGNKRGVRVNFSHADPYAPTLIEFNTYFGHYTIYGDRHYDMVDLDGHVVGRCHPDTSQTFKCDRPGQLGYQVGYSMIFCSSDIHA
ncbi:uncharacterized protein JN550_005160 [Neoarthrinium moseri]|uniref:uncharacterized protein n=1 Tax=Neoarthrinium moseri TaxID=1658444 RepID=UPI001FDDC708|nr:uncharacterized protein JN550_005160 [Neoarthrinium moseri]KAI1870617.1 hypothetical protein JN550_005160 [Neoarthrinium moseri]